MLVLRQSAVPVKRVAGGGDICKPRLKLPQSQREDQRGLGLQSAPDLQADEEVNNVERETSGQEASTSGSSSSNSLPYGLMAGLAAAGTLETAYLSYVKLTGSAPLCPISGCESVLTSSYSELFGIPLSLFGMLAYGAVGGIAVAGAIQKSKGESTQTVNALLTAGCATLVGVSAVLIYLLQTEFQGTGCSWCYLSATLSTSLLACLLISLPRSRLREVAGPGLGAFATAVLVLSMGVGSVEKSTAKDFELAYSAPTVTTPSSQQAKTLAKKLKEAGASMYGAFWCSHCFDQKEKFGAEAMKDFPYVECFPDGWKQGVKVVDACDAANVKAFPTWVINGKTLEGELTLDALEKELENPEVVSPQPPKSPFADS